MRYWAKHNLGTQGSMDVVLREITVIFNLQQVIVKATVTNSKVRGYKNRDGRGKRECERYDYKQEFLWPTTTPSSDSPH